jgi:hypothetical protein
MWPGKEKGVYLIYREAWLPLTTFGSWSLFYPYLPLIPLVYLSMIRSNQEALLRRLLHIRLTIYPSVIAADLSLRPAAHQPVQHAPHRRSGHPCSRPNPGLINMQLPRNVMANQAAIHDTRTRHSS